MLKERFRKRDLVGIALAILGAVTVVVASKSSDVRLDPQGLLKAVQRVSFIVYASITSVAIIILSILSERAIGHHYVYIDVGLCALFGGFTVLATKAVSTILSLEGLKMFEEPITYPLLVILAGTGVGQVKYLNRALMSFDSKVVVPTQFVLFTLAAIVGSAILYRDFDNIPYHRFIVFLYGCATTFIGVFILTRPDIQLAQPSPQEDESHLTTPTAPSIDLPPGIIAYSPLGSTPRTIRVSTTPILRHRSSRASLALSPAYLLLATATGSPPLAAPPHMVPVAPGSGVPVGRRTRSESRDQREPEEGQRR